ncbi:phage tail protein [Sphingomonas sp. LB3N6]|uniref:phage tail protein n=1 Tax=Sphingomonas fucosidasi TaxID=3096164 RepID=UPI002FC58957
MMALGMFVFSLPTLAYQEMQRKSAWRHARSGRIGAIDATQFVGRENDTITLSGTAYAELMAGRVSIDELRDMAAKGEAWPLIDGTGRVYGAFVITGIDDGMREFFADGTPRKIDFTVDLLEIADAAAGAA